jgi:ATP-dependent phosphoenolpyruvate carboxykinase
VGFRKHQDGRAYVSTLLISIVTLTITLDTFEINRERAIDYFNTRDNVYVFDGYAGVRSCLVLLGLISHLLFFQWDPKYRIKVRVICARAYHALFMVSLPYVVIRIQSLPDMI